jgi:hypothetical protein
MPMYVSDVPRQVESIYDTALELRSLGATAITSSTNETAIAFNPRLDDDFVVKIPHADVSSYTAGSAEWSVAVQVATTSGGTYYTVGSVTLKGTATTREVAISSKSVSDILSTAAYMRVAATKTGSPGGLTYGAFITTN